jgi:hypothetical protein
MTCQMCDIQEAARVRQPQVSLVRLLLTKPASSKFSSTNYY